MAKPNGSYIHVRINLLHISAGGYSQQSTSASTSNLALSAAAATAVAGGGVVVMECPQATMMGNHSEGDLWMVDIQLMYTQHWPAEQQLSQHEQSIQTQQQLLQQQILLSRSHGSSGMRMGDGIGTDVRMMVGGSDGVGVSSDSLKRPEKPLRELLEEQDIGKLHV